MASNVAVRDFSQCQPCLLDDKQAESNGFCTECEDSLCVNCMIEHKKNKTSKGHDVLSFRAVSESKNSVDKGKTQELSNEIQKIIISLKEKTQHNKEQLKVRSEHIAFQRKHVVDKLHKRIDDLEKTLQNETDLLFYSEQEMLSNDSEEWDKLERQKDTLSRLMLCIEGKEMQNKHLLLHEITTNLGTLKMKASSHLNKRSTQIVFVEGYPDLTSLGTVKKESEYEAEMGSECADSMEKEDKTKEEECSAKVQPIPVQYTKSKMTKQYVPIFNRQCTFLCSYHLPRCRVDVSDIVILENGCLVVADEANEMLYVLDENGKFLYDEQCNEAPMSICETGNSRIAVMFSVGNTIQRYRVSYDCMVNTGFFLSKFDCLAISRCDDDIALLVKCRDDSYVVEIRQVSNGKVLRNIQLAEDWCDNSYTSECLLCLNDGTYVADEGDVLQCFDDDGDDVWYYKEYSANNIIDEITGLAADDDDNVFVCCMTSMNVHQVSSKNYRKNRVILQDLDSPRSIAFDKSEERLYVGGSDTSEIQVYGFT